MKLKYSISSIIVVFSVLLFSCKGGTSSGSEPVEGRIYHVSVEPVAMILRKIAGDRAGIKVILPAGSSPHVFEPRPSDLKGLDTTLGLFYVHPDLDGWAASLPAKRIIILSLLFPPKHGLEPFPPEAADRDDDEHHHHEGEKQKYNEELSKIEGLDPHFWSDPLLVSRLVPELVKELCTLDEDGCNAYRKNGENFAAELVKLDQEFASELAPYKEKKVVLFHPSFNYLLRRYHLKAGAVIESVPGKEPSVKESADLIAKIKQGGWPIFNEPQLPDAPAKQLAEAVSAKVFTLDPIGGAEGRTGYAELMRFNVNQLKKAFDSK